MDSKPAHVSLYVPRELREAIAREAERNDRSMSAEIRRAIAAHVSAPEDALSPPVSTAPEGAEK